MGGDEAAGQRAMRPVSDAIIFRKKQMTLKHKIATRIAIEYSIEKVW